MKMLVFSDIHGSVTAARTIAQLNADIKPDIILLLGDILYHGPRNPLPQEYLPREAAEILSPLAYKIAAIKGNCDSEVDEVVLSFPLANHLWMMDGPVRIFATHGHRFGPDNMPKLAEGDVLLFGHTHVPTAALHETGVYLCNPGSLALPKEGHPRSYGLFEDGIFTVFSDTGEPYLQLDCN